MKTRPTDAEFDELKRKRDEGIRAAITALCEKLGWDTFKIGVHSHDLAAECYCACPEGPCQHIWDGPGRDILNDHDEPCGFETTCSRCGMGSMSHSLRIGM